MFPTKLEVLMFGDSHEPIANFMLHHPIAEEYLDAFDAAQPQQLHEKAWRTSFFRGVHTLLKPHEFAVSKRRRPAYGHRKPGAVVDMRVRKGKPDAWL